MEGLIFGILWSFIKLKDHAYLHFQHCGESKNMTTNGVYLKVFGYLVKHCLG